MSKIDPISIKFSPDVAASVAEAIAAGDYASSDEIVREALANWRLTRMVTQGSSVELDRLWREGRDSGDPVEGADVFARLRARFAGHPVA